MRKFHSYGPVDSRKHFTVPRTDLVNACRESLIGDPDEGGHFFTIWAPRQTGKTWLMRQVTEDIETNYGDRYSIAQMSCQGIIMEKDDREKDFLNKIPKLMLDTFDQDIEPPKSWEEWILFFHKRKGLFKKPLILFIDEFDSLPPPVIDRIVSLFRDVYLNRKDYTIHSLALIGVRAVLGAESERGSPFNIQRSLHVPNFTQEEVEDLFRQYQTESGQIVTQKVVGQVFASTRGQPGLVGWLGELLTEKYNPGEGMAIDLPVWEEVCQKALHREWNNTILNLIKKAQGKYATYVLELFTRSDMPFSIRADWCSYLYLNGIIDEDTVPGPNGKKHMVCRFSSPFIQNCLFDTFTLDLIGDRLPILPLEPTDRITDILDQPELDLPGLMDRYKNYLQRLKAKGLNPWREKPRRADMHLTEAVGHFHLYAWLQNAIGRYCTVSPEFPTGNGRVDLHLKCGDKTGIIEVKSFTQLAEMDRFIAQAAAYAESLSLKQVMIALFVPLTDESVLEQLSGVTAVDGVTVTVSAIGWG